MRRLRVVVAFAAVGVCLGLVGAAWAARPATRAERRGITALVLPRGNSYFRGGELAWAEVSTAGPYAVVYVSARPHNTAFQNAIEMVKRQGHRWTYIADVLNEDCPGVPERVLVDFRHFFAARKRHGLPGLPGYGACAARIAHAG